jgi:hypothetical protein
MPPSSTWPIVVRMWFLLALHPVDVAPGELLASPE